MKIAIKISLGFLAIVVMLSIVGYIEYLNEEQAHSSILQLLDNTISELDSLHQLESSVERFVFLSLEVFDLGYEKSTIDGAQEFEKHMSQVTLEKNNFETSLNSYKEHTGNEVESRNLVHIEEEWVNISQLSDDLINAHENNVSPVELLSIKSDLEEAKQRILIPISFAISFEFDEIKQRKEIIQSSFDSNYSITIGGIGIVIGTSIFVGLFVSRSMSNSISEIKQITNKIAKGDFKTKLNIKKNDEFQDLNKSIQKMSNDLEDYKNKLLEGEKINALGHVTSRLAHNLKNPLAVIKSTTDIITSTSQNNLDMKTQERMNLIQISIENMLNQIEDILDFVKKKPLELKETTLSAVLDSTVKNIGIPDSVKITLPDKDLSLKCDSAKLQVVLMNMLTNSIEAIEGTGEIIITSYQNMRETIIEITDSGIGIPPDGLEKIFDALYTTKPTGTGLGLPYCKSVVEQHGGVIEVITNPTKFTIILSRSI